MEIRGAKNSQIILKKGVKGVRTHTSQFQNLLQGYGNQDVSILAQGYIYEKMK